MTAGKNNTDDAVVTLLGQWFAEVSRNSSSTAYERVKKTIFRFALESGTGKRLPSIRNLSALFAAAPASVQRAATELIAEGVLTSKTGVGLFVSSRPLAPVSVPNRLESRGGDFNLRVPHRESEEARCSLMTRLVQQFRDGISGQVRTRLYFRAVPEFRPDVLINLPVPRNPLNLRQMTAHEIAAGRVRIVPAR